MMRANDPKIIIELTKYNDVYNVSVGSSFENEEKGRGVFRKDYRDLNKQCNFENALCHVKSIKDEMASREIAVPIMFNGLSEEEIKTFKEDCNV